MITLLDLVGGRRVVAVVSAGPLRGVVDLIESVDCLEGSRENARDDNGGCAGLHEAESDGQAGHAGAAGVSSGAGPVEERRLRRTYPMMAMVIVGGKIQ